VIGWTAAMLLALQLAQPAAPARRFSGDVSILGVGFPRQHGGEMRARASIDATLRPGAMTELHLDAFVEGLAANRHGGTGAAIARVREAWVQWAGRRADLRVGFGRLVWGRLDEIQPTDVINPIDASRFFLSGREDARLAVALVRGRLFASEDLTIEGVLVPLFRRATFDELGEATSPFNLINDAILPAGLALASAEIDRQTPATAGARLSGGARVSATIGRVDVAGAVYRGRDGFGAISFEPEVGIAPSPLVVGRLVERFPRFTMIGGDVETVAGEWALRGETAVFVDKTFAGASRPGLVSGRAMDAGAGADRRAGPFHVFASVVLHREWSAEDAAIARTDVNVIGSVERAFGRDRWLVRGFVVANPADRSGFVRGLAAWKLRDHVSIDASAGAFLGSGDDTIARFSGRDFVSGRVRYDW
jgi:hypothetical protein